VPILVQTARKWRYMFVCGDWL